MLHRRATKENNVFRWMAMEATLFRNVVRLDEPWMQRWLVWSNDADERLSFLCIWTPVCHKFDPRVREQGLTLWRVVSDQSVGPLEEGGSSGSAGIGTGSAAIELGADDGAVRQSESEEHDTQVPIVKTSPKSHTPQEVEARHASGHVRHRSWCRHCVSARAIRHPHPSSVKDDETIPADICDYAYMIDNGSPDTIPILAIRDRTTTAAISKTGVILYAVQYFVGFMRELGCRHYISRSDGEYSRRALKNAVRDAMPEVETIPKQSLVGDHAVDGEYENAVKEVKRQARELKSSIEEKLQQHVPADHPLLTWPPRHGADCLTI